MLSEQNPTFMNFSTELVRMVLAHFLGIKSLKSHMDNIKILLLDTNDTRKEKLIHVSESACAWVLNDAVGENFGNPLTLFVQG